MFSEKEKDHLASQVMLRLGNAIPGGNPNVTPINYTFDDDVH